MGETRALPHLFAHLRAALTAALVFLYVFVVGTPFVLHARWTRRIDPLYRIARWGAAMGLWLAGIRLELHGEENLPRGRPCVYMANHQSNVDAPLLFVLLPPRIALMGKRQVFSIPVLGAALRLADFVRVDRENPEAARASVDEALRHLQRGTSFLVFPEGTRTPDGRLQRFKHGVFVLALRAGVPIVPITLDGAATLMAKGKWEIYPGVVRVTIHPPVEIRHRSLEERQRLAEEVRAVVASALPEESRATASSSALVAGEPDEPR